YIQYIGPLSSDQLEKEAIQAIQDLSVKEGEELTDSEKRALAKRTFYNKINNALNINSIKTSFINCFRLSETFTNAMRNNQ
ncbi:hypothetical protein NAI68_11225, partial [Francisella tularensis subsp. holarctica]|nr:hypothetical protein [Francisella tularensis subsp. holarctica]